MFAFLANGFWTIEKGGFAGGFFDLQCIAVARGFEVSLCRHYGRGHLWGHCGNRQGVCLSDDNEADWDDGMTIADICHFVCPN